MGLIDRQRYEAVRKLQEIGYEFKNGEWVPDPLRTVTLDIGAVNGNNTVPPPPTDYLQSLQTARHRLQDTLNDAGLGLQIKKIVIQGSFLGVGTRALVAKIRNSPSYMPSTLAVPVGTPTNYAHLFDVAGTEFWTEH